MHPIQHLLLVTLLGLCSAIFLFSAPPAPPTSAPAKPPADAASQDDEKIDAKSEAVREERAKTWTLHARAAAHRVELDEKPTEKLVEMYVKHRQQLEELIQEMRREWIVQLEERIERAREAGGSFPASTYDRSELNSNIFAAQQRARIKLAEAMVELIEKEKADKIFHSLAAFDRRIDTLISKLVEFELEDERAFPVVDVIDDYFEETVIQSRINYPDERARAKAIRAVREEFIKRVTPHLTTEQLAEYKAYFGIR